MKIVCQPAQLRAALKIVSKNVPPRTPQPILTTVLIDASKVGVTLSTTNGIVFTTARMMSGAEVSQPGTVCISFKKLEEFAAKMDAPITLTVDTDKLKANLECGNYKAKNIDCLPAEDFPSMPDAKWETSVEMDGSEFVKRVERALISATHKEDSTGKESLCFYIKDGKLAMICRDAFRMSYVNGVDVDGADGEYVVPEETMNIVKGIARDFNSVIIHLSKNRIWFEWVGASLYSTLLAAKFSYVQLAYLSDPLKQRVTVKRVELERALAVNNIFCKDRQPGMEDLLKFEVGENSLRVYSDDDAFGDAVMAAEVDGENTSFITSCNQVQDFLKVANTESVVLGLGKDINVIFLKPDGEDDFVNMLAVVNVTEAGQ